MKRAINRLTEKRMADRRFRSNEEKIIDVFIGGDNYISTEEMARRAGMARSTFYCHHRTVGRIVPDYERYILRRYERFIRRLSREKVSLKMMYLQSLYFIFRNKKSFRMLIKYNGRDTIMEMLKVLNSKVAKFARLSRSNRRMLSAFDGEILELIYDWIKKGYSEQEIEELAREMVHLASTIRKRLGRIK